MELTPLFFGLYKLVKYGVYPLTWIVLLAGCTMVLAWLPPAPARRRLVKLAAASTVLVLYLVTTPLVAGPAMSLLEDRPDIRPLEPSDRFQAIVVLSGGVKDRGTLRPSVSLSGESSERMRCGADLYLNGYAPTLLVTGGTVNLSGAGPKESDVMKDWAVRLGVPPDAIVTETQARTTYENALETKRLLGERRMILLVTSAYHMPRAVGVFRAIEYDEASHSMMVVSYAVPRWLWRCDVTDAAQ